MKKLLVIILTLSTLLSCVACNGEDNSGPKEATFTHESGISITLDESFKESEYESYTVCFESENILILVLKEPFTLTDGLEDYTLIKYAGLLREANTKHSPTAISTDDGLTSFEYGYFNKDQNVTYKYYTTAFKGSDAFWTVQFACKAEEYDALKSTFVEYAKTVKVTD